MAKKTSIDRLGAAIHDILAEYGDDVQENLSDAAKRVTKKGAQAVKSAARSTFGGTGEYAAGWTSRTETGRFSAQGVIYNKDVPGLPHLLENGHVIRNGTRRVYGDLPGREHIKPVEETIAKEFEAEVKKGL